MNSRRSLVATLAASLLLLGLAACGGSSTRTVSVASPRATMVASANLQHSFVDVINRVEPEVVQITTSRGLGSGVVFDNKGDVVTNAHVVAGGGHLRVTDAHGHTYGASLVGSFTEDDLAVVHAKSASLRAAAFAKSSALQVGDIVLALGNPLGLRSSVTNGIVSALGRTVNEPSGVVLPNVIQTSAPINPGNSGGALVDLSGQVVGIPTLAATDPQLGGGAAPGIGFAIPSSVVTDIASQIVKHGHVINSHRAYLGIAMATGLVGRGALVASVQSGGPAAQAGISVGDLITSLDRRAITSPSELAGILATLKPGQTVSVGIKKGAGGTKVLKVKLGTYPGNSS